MCRWPSTVQLQWGFTPESPSMSWLVLKQWVTRRWLSDINACYFSPGADGEEVGLSNMSKHHSQHEHLLNEDISQFQINSWVDPGVWAEGRCAPLESDWTMKRPRSVTCLFSAVVWSLLSKLKKHLQKYDGSESWLELSVIDNERNAWILRRVSEFWD